MPKIKFILSLIQILMLFLIGFIIIFSSSTIILTLKNSLIILLFLVAIISLISFFGYKQKEHNQYFHLFNGFVTLWIAIFAFDNYPIFISYMPSIIAIHALIIALNFLLEYYLNNTISPLYLTSLFCMSTFALLLGLTPLELATFYTKLSGFYFISLSLFLLIVNTLKIIETKEEMER